MDEPVEYVRRVLGNMVAVRREFGSAFVRVGTKGRGIAPHYRVVPEAPDLLKGLDDLLDGEDRHGQYMAFYGRSHERLPSSIGELRGEHWSSGHMSYDDVATHLGNLRRFTAR